jgi:hypothetical protein
MKKVIKAAGIAAVAAGVVAVGMQMFSPAPVVSKGAVYGGRMYVAGHGGHIAVADIQIDPTSDKPLTVTKLDRIEIGTPKSHPFHDVRIDPANRDLLFYSTYKLDATEGPNKGKLHFGSVDIKGDKVIKDVALAPDARATADGGFTGANYCASGQSKDFYFPVTMAMEGYIDVIEKATMTQKYRVFLDSLVGKSGYQFMHGNTSPDMSTFLLVVNKATGTPKEGWGTTGELALFLLDVPALEKGELKVVKQATIVGGNPKSTITFRQYFTPDGKYVLQSANDMFYVIDAKTLELVAKENRQDGMNHDAFPTPDSKFAILTLRKKSQWEGCNEPIQDGMIQVYDIENKKLLGAGVSVCYACHKDADVKKDAILCGIDGNWNKN